MTLWGYLLLAAVVFVLAAAIIILWDKLKRSRNEEEGGTIRDKEQRLFRLYQNLEDMISSMEEYVEEVLEDFDRGRAEMTAMLQEMRRLSEHGASYPMAIKEALPYEKTEVEKPPARSEKAKKASGRKTTEGTGTKAVESTGKGRGKVESVRTLFEEGKGEEEIARVLSLSQGEVALIIGMLGGKERQNS